MKGRRGVPGSAALHPEYRDGGMAALREMFLKGRIGIVDPYAHLFVTREMRQQAALAYQNDRRSLAMAMARFNHFTHRIASAAKRFRQILILGVGYDTRAIWLPEISENGVMVQEVDLPETMSRKVAILAENGIGYPANVVPVGADLGSADLPATLRKDGFDPSRATAVFLEGVVFQLGSISGRLLAPDCLGLAPGSEITFDCWSNARIAGRNAKLGAIGFPMIAPFPFPDEPNQLQAAIEGLGYRDVRVLLLADLADQLWPDEHDGDTGASWMVVEAAVAD